MSDIDAVVKSMVEGVHIQLDWGEDLDGPWYSEYEGLAFSIEFIEPDGLVPSFYHLDVVRPDGTVMHDSKHDSFDEACTVAEGVAEHWEIPPLPRGSSPTPEDFA